MKGFNLISNATDKFTLSNGGECEQHIAVYQSKRSENSFKIVETCFFPNGEQRQTVTKADRQLARLTLEPIFGENWKAQLNPIAVH